MTARELMEWLAFERDFGPLTVQERIDYAGANVRAALVGGDIEKHLPGWQREEAPEEAAAPVQQSDEELMGFMRGMQAKHAKRRKRRKG